MTLGSYNIEVLSEGRFEIFRDGHINRSPRTLVDSAPNNLSENSSSIMAGINPLLIQTGDANILLDTGLGWGLDYASEYEDVSNIRTNLKIFDIDAHEITHVILSHLHYDHAAGSSYTDDQMRTRPTFPNATYFVHRKEWEFALNYVDTHYTYFGADYELDEFYRLVADDRVTFLEEDETNILEGLTAIRTGGHTPGHLVVKMESNGECAYYLADLVPTAFHLNQYAMNSADVSSLDSKKRKTHILQQACSEQAYLFLYHSRHGGTGRLLQDEDKQYVLADLA